MKNRSTAVILPSAGMVRFRALPTDWFTESLATRLDVLVNGVRADLVVQELERRMASGDEQERAQVGALAATVQSLSGDRVDLANVGPGYTSPARAGSTW